MMLALGIISDPREVRRRARIRETWLPINSTAVVSYFVLGNVSTCVSKDIIAAETAAHSDLVCVPTGDCVKWYSPLKVHAWFVFALEKWPHAAWFGKMEDDGMLKITALLNELRALGIRRSAPVYIGMMQWTGSCTLNEARREGGGEQKCGGCWAGWFSYGGSNASSVWDRPRLRAGLGSDNCAGLVARERDRFECPRARLSPFACGPLDVRSNALAGTVARCDVRLRHIQA